MKFCAFSHGDIRHMSGMYASHKPMTPTALGDHRRREFEPRLWLTFANDKIIVAARWRFLLFFITLAFLNYSCCSCLCGCRSNHCIFDLYKWSLLCFAAYIWAFVVSSIDRRDLRQLSKLCVAARGSIALYQWKPHRMNLCESCVDGSDEPVVSPVSDTTPNWMRPDRYFIHGCPTEMPKSSRRHCQGCRIGNKNILEFGNFFHNLPIIFFV